MERHPMPKFANGVHFSRPFTPFKCGGVYGATEGCGPGTYCSTELTGARTALTGIMCVGEQLTSLVNQLNQ